MSEAAPDELAAAATELAAAATELAAAASELAAAGNGVAAPAGNGFAALAPAGNGLVARAENGSVAADTRLVAAADTTDSDLPRHKRHLPLLLSSFSLSVSAGVAAFGGFIFWLLVAHVAPTATVGRAAALFSSIQFVNYATGLGLPIAVARYGGGRSRDPSVLFNWSVVFTVVSSFIGAAIYFACVPHELHALSALGVAGSFLIFGLIVAGISIGTVLDVRLISQHRRSWVVVRAAFITVVRLPFLFIHGLGHSTIAIFLVAAGAPAIAGFGAWLIADICDGRFGFPLHPLPPDARPAFNYAMVNGAAQLAMQAPFYALPVIVLLLVSAKDNASFYVAWTIATVVFLIVQSIGQALLVEGNRSGRLESQTRTALQFGVALAVVLAVICAVGSKVLPILYGSSYDAGARILPILGVAVIPWAVYSIVLSAARVNTGHTRNLVLSTLFAVSIVGPAIVLVDMYGIKGGADGWLFGNVLSAITAVVMMRHLFKSSPVDDAIVMTNPPPPIL
jgi:O-antigen/teichoic acid export membrane protein